MIDIFKQKSGFTLLEVLFVVLITGVLMSILVVFWQSNVSISHLNNKVMELATALKYCQTSAILTANNWFLRFDTVNQSYTIINDDGWLGTTNEVDLWGNKWPARNFFLGNTDFSEDNRNNGIEDSNEFDRGPCTLGSGLVFLDATAITQITYIPTGDCYNDLGSEDAVIWIASQEYLSVYQGNVEDGTADQRKFRKGIKITSITGNVEVIN